MSSYFMDLMLDNMRLQSMQRICKCYKPSVPVEHVVGELGFESNEEAIEFLKLVGCVLKPVEVAAAGASGGGGGGGGAASKPKAGAAVTKIHGTHGAHKSTQWEIDTKESVVNTQAVFTQRGLLL